MREIITIFKRPVIALAKPYGTNFGKPTGRFTNDWTMVDILGNHFLCVIVSNFERFSLHTYSNIQFMLNQGQYLGVHKFIPPYLHPTTVGDVVLKGVN